MSTTDTDSIPMLPPDDSPGSSVSSSLQDEYQELLQYAVVTPYYDPSQLPQTLAGAAQAFQPHRPVKDQLIYMESAEESSETSSSEASARFGESVVATHGSVNGETTPTGSQGEDGRGGQDLSRKDLSAPRPDPSSPTRVQPLDSPRDSDTPNTDQSTLTNDSSYSAPSSPAVDQDILRVEKMLDNWSLELKRSVLAELSQSKIGVIQRYRQEVNVLKERHQRELRRLQNEIEGQKELLHTFEQSVERKDQIISNLTRAVQKEKDRFELLRRFESWKLRHNEDRRQAFTTKLARQHHERQLKSKVWSAWHSIIVARWRQRVEKACQGKAQEVCMNLTNDYEARLASLNEALESSRVEVTKLHAERDHYEESMKKAFMRGVCALNMEAMAMFHEGEGGNAGGQAPPPPPPPPSSGPSTMPPSQVPLRPPPASTAAGPPRGQGQAPTGQPSGQRMVNGHSSLPQTHRSVSGAPKKTSGKTSQSSKTVTARVSARSDLHPAGSMGHGGLNPPMASIVVERHHPITQQTVGHATAARFPVSTQSLPAHPSASTRSGAGVTSKRPLHSTPGAPTVKVVH